MPDAPMRLVLLGSVASVPDETHDNIYMALDAPQAAWLIDCAGSPLARLRRAGIEWDRLAGLIVTHAHADHIYGVPILLQGLWLAGRREPFTIYGHGPALSVIRRLMALFNWEGWTDSHPVDFVEIALRPAEPVIDTPQLEILATPVEHSAANIGLRLRNKGTGGVVAYSSDTEPGEHVVRLARQADILIHEATGAHPGHSSGADAGRDGREAGAGRLVLVHYPSETETAAAALRQAQAIFGPAVELGQDFNVYEF